MPAMRANWRSSGAATDDAMVSGLAPGSDADTEIAGKSTCGSAATGRKLYAMQPEIPNAAASSAVPAGRSIKTADRRIEVESVYLHVFAVSRRASPVRPGR